MCILFHKRLVVFPENYGQKTIKPFSDFGNLTSFHVYTGTITWDYQCTFTCVYIIIYLSKYATYVVADCNIARNQSNKRTIGIYRTVV